MSTIASPGSLESPVDIPRLARRPGEMIQQAWSGRGCWHRVREHEPYNLPPLEAETVNVDVDRTFGDAGVSGEIRPGDVGLSSEQFGRLPEGESLGGTGGRSATQRLGGAAPMRR